MKFTVKEDVPVDVVVQLDTPAYFQDDTFYWEILENKITQVTPSICIISNMDREEHFRKNVQRAMKGRPITYEIYHEVVKTLLFELLNGQGGLFVPEEGKLKAR